jgi:nucleoside-diphosphate-sugar epimerase
VALRFGLFHAADSEQTLQAISLARKGMAMTVGRPDAYLSIIEVGDAARAVVAALDAPAGVYNVVDDEPVTAMVFFGSLAGSLGLRRPRFLPSWVTPLFGSVGDALARSLRLSNRKLEQQTRWVPQYPSIREGWPATLEQMKEAQRC